MLPATAPSATKGPRQVGLLLFLAVVIFSIFSTLGVWQIQRLSWKRNLIERVEQRVHAEPVAAPIRAQWPDINTANSEYRRIHLQGRYLQGLDTLVQAVTKNGSGFWVLTPLQQSDGTIVIVNRGFIPPEASRTAIKTSAETMQLTSVTGLLRMSQQGGAFLRKNDPPRQRWYSRDIQAIAASKNLSQVAPYFVDADAISASAQMDATSNALPVGGLTVIAFQNSHLVYALTWFTLAAMVAGITGYFLFWLRREGRQGQLSRKNHQKC